MIAGAGMSGICMGIKLREAGIESFRIFEKAAEAGGTWRDNTYPGLVCDVPSRFYSYSFDSNPDWSRVYSPSAEIKDYFDRAADRFGVRPKIEFGREVKAARWEDGRWRIELADGERVEADFFVSACGVLHHPRYPAIEGIEDFEGAAFHSARWDHSVELRGKRVGVVGSGSTGVQIVTALAGVAGRLSLFQRTAQWVFPFPNFHYREWSRRLMRHFPALRGLAYQGWQRWFEGGVARAVVEPGRRRQLIGAICRANLRSVRDPGLRRRLTPPDQPMCKRLVVSGGFYRAVQRPGVEVVTDAIERVEPRGVVTRDGRLHELDVLVLATGFDAHAYLRPIELVGDGGVTLAEAWRDGPRAHRTVALPGFPNFFMLIGPHSPVGNQSVVMIAESQADFVLGWIRRFRDGEMDAVTPRPEAMARYYEELRAALPNTVWMTGCDSWYLGADGLPELWPWTPERHREMLAEPLLEEFDVRVAEPVA